MWLALLFPIFVFARVTFLSSIYKKQFEHVHLGASEEEILKLMGRPDSINPATSASTWVYSTTFNGDYEVFFDKNHLVYLKVYMPFHYIDQGDTPPARRDIIENHSH